MAEVTEYRGVNRKMAVDLMAIAFGIERERAYRITQIADEFGISAVPVTGGLFRVFPIADGNYVIEDHRG